MVVHSVTCMDADGTPPTYAYNLWCILPQALEVVHYVRTDVSCVWVAMRIMINKH